jgi:hypothetical protein
MSDWRLVRKDSTLWSYLSHNVEKFIKPRLRWVEDAEKD